MNMFDREILIQNYIEQRDREFYEKVKYYDFDYMTAWSESSGEEKHDHASMVIDRKIKTLEAKNFMAVMDEKTGSAIKFIDLEDSFRAAEDYKLRDEYYNKYPVLREDNLCGLVTISDQEMLKIIGAPNDFDHETQVALNIGAEWGGKMMLALFTPPNAPCYAVCQIDCNDESHTSVTQKIKYIDNVEPASLMANILHNAVSHVLKQEMVDNPHP